MKTPDEIKKDAKTCMNHPHIESCNSCRLYGECHGISDRIVKELYDLVLFYESRLAQSERERDAMFHDLFRYGPECRTCKNHGGDYASLPCSDCVEASKISKVLRWQWRGVCPENSKEETK